MESKVRMKKEVIIVLKTNENIVRDTAEKKKNVIIYKLKEKVIPMGIKREKEDTKCIKEILKQLNDADEDTKFEEEVEVVMRLDPYIEGGVRPIKLRLKIQTATKESLARTYHPRDIEEYKTISDMTRLSSYISLFADDTNLLRKIKNLKEELQNDINKIYERSRT